MAAGAVQVSVIAPLRGSTAAATPVGAGIVPVADGAGVAGVSVSGGEARGVGVVATAVPTVGPALGVPSPGVVVRVGVPRVAVIAGDSVRSGVVDAVTTSVVVGVPASAGATAPAGVTAATAPPLPTVTDR